MGVEVRKMSESDVDAVCVIERECFSAEAWPRDDFEALASGDGGEVWTALVAADAETVCGYICGSCVAGELEIGSVAVAHEFRRKGLARRLISELETRTGAQKAFLEVRKSNTAARTLYESLGFREIAVRKNYYDKPPEDAVIMKKLCAEH